MRTNTMELRSTDLGIQVQANFRLIEIDHAAAALILWYIPILSREVLRRKARWTPTQALS